jgi:hypothetical protein
MLLATALKPKGFGGDHLYEVSEAEAVIATMNETRLTFEHGGSNYAVLRKGGLFPKYVLKSGDAEMASAAQAAFVNKFTVIAGENQWLLKAEGITAQKFGLFKDDLELGTLSAGGWTSKVKGFAADLPGEVAVPVQLFLLLILMRSWTATNN